MRRKCCSSPDEKLVKRLVAAGRPMPAEIDQELPRDVTVEVTRPDVTVAYDMRAGAEFVFGIRIKNESYTPLVLQVFQCRLPWAAEVFFLGDPRIYTPECQAYRLPSGREFPYDDVIDWRLGEKGVTPTRRKHRRLAARLHDVYPDFARIPTRRDSDGRAVSNRPIRPGALFRIGSSRRSHGDHAAICAQARARRPFRSRGNKIRAKARAW